MRFPNFRNQVAVLAALFLIPASALAQDEEGPSAASLTVSPEEITLTAGETAQIEATALDEDGNQIEVEFLYLPLYGQFWNLEMRTWGFNIFKVSREGEVSTRRPGEYAVMVRVVGSGPDPSARNTEAEGVPRAADPADHPAAAGSHAERHRGRAPVRGDRGDGARGARG